MQITIEVSDQLAVQAQALGLTPGEYLRSLIDEAALTAPVPIPPAEPKMNIKEFIRAMSANSENIPQLPDAAFTRESFYQDHD